MKQRQEARQQQLLTSTASPMDMCDTVPYDLHAGDLELSSPVKAAPVEDAPAEDVYVAALRRLGANSNINFEGEQAARDSPEPVVQKIDVEPVIESAESPATAPAVAEGGPTAEGPEVHTPEAPEVPTPVREVPTPEAPEVPTPEAPEAPEVPTPEAPEAPAPEAPEAPTPEAPELHTPEAPAPTEEGQVGEELKQLCAKAERAVAADLAQAASERSGHNCLIELTAATERNKKPDSLSESTLGEVNKVLQAYMAENGLSEEEMLQVFQARLSDAEVPVIPRIQQFAQKKRKGSWQRQRSRQRSWSWSRPGRCCGCCGRDSR